MGFVAMLLGAPGANAAPISNGAIGSASGVGLDPAGSSVTLNRVSVIASSIAAEISPNAVLTSDRDVTFIVDALPVIEAGHAGVERLMIELPAGFANVSVTGVRLAGQAQSPGSPAGPDEFEATLDAQTLTVAFGTPIVTTGTRISVTFVADPPGAAGATTFGVSAGNGASAALTALEGDADGDVADSNTLGVDVIFSRGLVLALDKLALASQAVVGDVVTYRVEVRNTSDGDVENVVISDTPPPGFDFVERSARLDGVPLADPAAGRTLRFAIGTVPGLVDANGNGSADRGEPGFSELLYQLVVGSGASPGQYDNVAIARDCDICAVSNLSRKRVQVVLDPDLDLGTIIGKVYLDRDGDGEQSADEMGVAGARVVLDDGTITVTDVHGRFHLPLVEPGHRMVKLDIRSVPGGSARRESHVVWMTPGLIRKVSFALETDRTIGSIGGEGVTGLIVAPRYRWEPLEIRGNAFAMDALVNDRRAEFQATDVELVPTSPGAMVELVGSQLPRPVEFELLPAHPEVVDRWVLSIFGPDGTRVRSLEGDAPVPPSVSWDGRIDDGGFLVAGEIYQYQLAVTTVDGSWSTSARKQFGVKRTSIISLNLTGEAFESGSDRLSLEARAVLEQAAETLRDHSDETVLIEGHTDDVGTSDYNLDLSRRRAEAAAGFLRQVADLSSEQIVLRWYGESRPVAPNDDATGRALNRRVEIRGEAKEVTVATIHDQYRTGARAVVAGDSLVVHEDGRFFRAVSDTALGAIDIEIADRSGRSLATRVAVPSLEILQPRAPLVVASGAPDAGIADAAPGGWEASAPSASGVSRVNGRLIGRTEPGNEVELGGVPVEVGEDGRFSAPLTLDPGPNVLGLLVRNAEGFMRVVNIDLAVSRSTATGAAVYAIEPTPRLELDLPPEGTDLPSTQLVVSGRTAPGNRVDVNGIAMETTPDGRVHGVVELPSGASTLVAEVEDPEGRTGRLERNVRVSAHELFLLAFADATLGARYARGHLEAAGQDESREYVAEGRVAFYLEGRVAGDYLVTAALDTRQRSSHELFQNLSDEELEVLATTLDPHRMYPVYGDGSTLVHGAESQGKLYVAIDGEEVAAVFGNYGVRFGDTELAAYHRTLYGGRFHYRSTSRDALGRVETEIFVFGSESRHRHVRDVVRATGGSLYYLSHRDVVEGSDQIARVVRDVHSGLVLSRFVERRNVDYSIKHLEGRILFRRPIASVSEGGTLADPEILGGNPVFLEIDYEVLSGDDRDVTGGVRARRSIGGRLTLGGTYVDDVPEADAYELAGADAEVRIGARSRVLGELAHTKGSDAAGFVSTDGGLSYVSTRPSAGTEGNAFKVAAELEIGELVGRPGDYWLRGYVKRLESGFRSAGNAQEGGTEKLGVDVDLALPGAHAFAARFDLEDRLGPRGPGDIDRTGTGTVYLARLRERWGASVEVHASRSETAAGARLGDVVLGTARAWARVREAFTIELERQETLNGDANDQTTLGASYRASEHVALSLRGTSGTRGESFQAGAELSAGDRRLYVSERVAEGSAPGTSTVVGVESAIGGSGRAYSEHRWGRAGRGAHRSSVSGVEQKFAVLGGLSIALAAEAAHVEMPSGITRRTSVSGLTAYAVPTATITSRNEVRVEDGATDRTQFVTASRVDLRVLRDLSVLGTFRLSETRDRATDRMEARLNEHSLGVAFRPVRHDRAGALARYTRRLDLRPFGDSGSARQREMDVLSSEAVVDIGSRLQWAGKAAARILRERFMDLPEVETRTYLGVLRLDTRLWRDLAIGAEYRMLTQREAEDRRSGVLSELTWALVERMRIGAGYNFTDFSDDEFAMNDYSVHGWFLRVQGRY